MNHSQAEPDLEHGVLIVFEPLPKRQYADQAFLRLKRLLKHALRTCGMRAEFYRPLAPGELHAMTRPKKAG